MCELFANINKHDCWSVMNWLCIDVDMKVLVSWRLDSGRVCTQAEQLAQTGRLLSYHVDFVQCQTKCAATMLMWICEALLAHKHTHTCIYIYTPTMLTYIYIYIHDIYIYIPISKQLKYWLMQYSAVWSSWSAWPFGGWDHLDLSRTTAIDWSKCILTASIDWMLQGFERKTVHINRNKFGDFLCHWKCAHTHTQSVSLEGSLW